MILRGRVVSGGSDIADGIVSFSDDRIEWVGAVADCPTGMTVPAAGDDIIMPGLIDLHCHGGNGGSFPDVAAPGSGLDSAHAAASFHLSRGTTGLLGSLVSSSAADLEAQIDALAGLWKSGDLLGIHLEGPFLSSAKCGAQNPAAIIAGDPALFGRLVDAGGGAIRSMTAAPETPHFGELMTAMHRAQVLPSLGHTNTDVTTMRRAIDRADGLPITATHLFNAMPPLLHRAPGPVAACIAAAARGEMVTELIADGTHLADELVSMMFDLVGPEHITLISDAMAAAGKVDGRYRLGELDVDVRRGVARLAVTEPDQDPDTRPIAGGTSTLLDVVRRTVMHAGVDLGAAVHSATAVPARLLGIDGERGLLVEGLRADLLVTGPELGVRHVFLAGRRITSKGESWK